MTILSVSQALGGVKPALPLLIENSVGTDDLNTIYISNPLTTSASGVVLTSRDQLSSPLWKQTNAAPGLYNYITRVDMCSTQISTPYGNARGHGLLIVDSLWASTGILPGTSLQTINSVELPARDINESILGEGIIAVFSTGFSIGAAGGNITITYTNSQGVSGRTSIVSFPGSTLGFSARIIDFDTGDTGIRSIQSIQFDTDHISGVFYLWLVRPLVFVSADHAKRSYNGINNIYTTKIFDNTVFLPIGFRSQSGYIVSSTIYLSEG